MEGELRRVDNEILNLENFINFGLGMRSNVFNLWELADLGDKRRVQNMVFPEGFLYRKEIGDIDPLELHRVFTITDSKSAQKRQNKNGQTSEKSDLSAWAPCLGLEPRTP